MSVYKNQNTATKWNAKTKKALIEWLEQSHDAKSNIQISIFLKISEKTFYTWKQMYDDFAEIVEVHAEVKKQAITDDFLSGKVPWVYYQFVMTNCYGYMPAHARKSLELKAQEIQANQNQVRENININFNQLEKPADWIEG